MSLRLKFALIIVLAVVAGILAYPKEGQILSLVGLKHTNLYVHEGLDLQGGAELIFQANQADLNKLPVSQRSQAMSSLVSNLEQRANFSGMGEAQVQQESGNRVLIDLPGVKNVDTAINTLKASAQLAFFELPPNSQYPIPVTDLSGKDLASATPDIDPTSGQPIIDFTLKSEAVKKFADLTTKINQENGQLIITLDGQTLFNGSVQSPILTGQGQLQGLPSIAAAQETSQLLNAGALPVPVTLIDQTTVGPTLGLQSVNRSIVAGLIGLGIVALFMISYYRLAGVLAVLALGIYALITLTLYKLSVFVPGFTIVLTLGGIAGFIISIGMAVDANILIFERLKEEVRSGKSFNPALETAFQRAWTSIRDSNVSTLITCAILYHFGTTEIKSFAFTLGLGVLLSLFTSVVISRTLLRVVARQKWGRRPSWYGIRLGKAEGEAS